MKLLITGEFQYKQEQLDALRELGAELVFTERADAVLEERALQADGVVCNWLFVHNDIKQFKKLKFIQLLSAGFDRVPLDYINKNSIKLCNARGVYSIPMAEFAVGSVLQIYKNSKKMAEQQKSRIWEKHRNLLELNDKRILILGAGSVGCETARRFKAFTSNVYGIDLYPVQKGEFNEVYHISMLDDELEKSDIVVLTLPLTEETKNLFDRKRLFKMKKGAVLVNIARGGLIDEGALSEALKEHLLGAALDVFQTEPLPKDSELWECSNLIISPHNSFVSEGNNNRMWKCIYGNLENFLRIYRGG